MADFTVLVADDEAGVRTVLRTMLHVLGCRVLIAKDGAEALSVATRNGRVDLAIIDQDMPLLDGLSVCCVLRARFPEAHIVISSAAPLPYPVGPTGPDLFPKPYGLDEVMGLLRAAGHSFATTLPLNLQQSAHA